MEYTEQPKQSKKDDKYSVECLKKRINAGKKHREKFEDRWARNLRKYNGSLNCQRKDWQSTLSIPAANMMIEQLVADEMDMLYANGAPFDVRPSANNWFMAGHEREGEFIDAADRLDKYCKWQVKRVENSNRKFENASRYKYLVGTKILKIYNTGAPHFENTFDEVNPYSFIIEPGATSIKNAKWCCQELLMDKDWARSMFESGLFSEIEGFEIGGYKTMLEEETAKVPHSKERQNEFGQSIGEDSNTIEYKDKVNMWEYWENDKLVVILNCKYKVRDEVNPYIYESPTGKVFAYKPFVASNCNNNADEFWGSGFLDPYVDMLDAYDLSVNMQIDAAKMAMNPMRFSTRNSGLSGTIEYYPGRVNPLRSLDDIRSENYETARAAAKDIEYGLRNKVEGLSGQTSEWGGRTNPSSNDTATGVSIMVDRASKRMQFFIKKEIDLIREFGEIWICLNRKFIDEPKGTVVRKINRTIDMRNPYPFTTSTKSEKMSVETINKNDMEWDMEIVVEPPWNAPNEMVFQQNMTQAVQNLKGMPEVDATVLIKNYVKALKFPEPEGLILEGQEIVDHAVEQAKLNAMTQIEVQKATQQFQQTLPGQIAQPEQMSNANAVTNTAAPTGVPGENQFTGV